MVGYLLFTGLLLWIGRGLESIRQPLGLDNEYQVPYNTYSLRRERNPRISRGTACWSVVATERDTS